MLDIRLISVSHLFLFLVSFILTYAGVQIGVEQQRHGIAFVGAVIVGVLVACSALILEDIHLLIGLSLSAVFIILIGGADERSSLPPIRQLMWQFVIAGFVVWFGWVIPYITNPVGEGLFYFSSGAGMNILLSGSFWALLWLVFMMNSMNWLDGLDGLAGGVGFIAFLVLAAISLLPATQDSQTLSLALIGAGSVLAFLIWNFPPAKAYLGTSGSWFLGLFLGLVAIQGGGKIATTLLVLAIPALDALFVIAQRLIARRPPWRGDRERHIHHRLMAAGLPPKAVLLLLVALSGALGVMAVTFQTTYKVWTFGVVAVLMAVFLLRGMVKQSVSRKSY